MGANIAGIYGAQIFRSDDKPRYRRAFSVNIGVLAFGLALAVGRYIDDRILRRKGRALGTLGPGREGGGDRDGSREGRDEENGAGGKASSSPEERDGGMFELAK
jgi:hypothetical protein